MRWLHGGGWCMCSVFHNYEKTEYIKKNLSLVSMCLFWLRVSNGCSGLRYCKSLSPPLPPPPSTVVVVLIPIDAVTWKRMNYAIVTTTNRFTRAMCRTSLSSFQSAGLPTCEFMRPEINRKKTKKGRKTIFQDSVYATEHGTHGKSMTFVEFTSFNIFPLNVNHPSGAHRSTVWQYILLPIANSKAQGDASTQLSNSKNEEKIVAIEWTVDVWLVRAGETAHSASSNSLAVRRCIIELQLGT